MGSTLEDVLSGALGKALGGDSDKGKMVSALLPIIVGMLAKGGLSKILDQMRAQGLSAQADSWIGTGENKPITAEQAAKVVGSRQVKEIAEQVGLPEGEAAALIAKALPAVVDRASPEGEEPDQGSLAELLGPK